MLGLEPRFKDLYKMLPVSLGWLMKYSGVERIAVNNPEVVSEPLQRRGQLEICSRGVCPYRVAAGSSYDNASEH